VHLRVELNNPAKEPRWVIVSLGARAGAKDGRFNVDPESGLPVFGSSENESGRAAMVASRRSAVHGVLLPAEAKSVFEDSNCPRWMISRN